ncbi:ABC transporter substrate-binding protein [Deinococcus pimensis]|uniref:ABC transporter substrate-binding protein n=1 Tax=Deinococcus pimensis TaxID=309888 RepID=UPI0004849501|nr:sugar ABC transporter substrate-binding protein [Deinococcus pimensis]
MKRFAMLSLALALTSSTVALAQKPVEIEFWTFYLSPKFDDYINGVIKAFEAQNPGIKVKYVDKQATLEQELISSINLGNAPDVVNLWSDSTWAGADNNLLLPMTDLVGRSELTRLYHANPLSNFEANGKVYGLPWYGSLDAGVMSYNTDLFKKAGITKLPTTTTELVAAAKAVKDKTGAYGWAPAIKDPNGASFLGTFVFEGLPIVQGGKAVFNSPAHAKLLQTYVDLYKQDYIPQELLRKEAFQLSTELYAQGKLATIIGGPQALTRIRDNNKEIYGKTAVVNAPLGAGKVQPGSGMDLVIPRASKHPKEALAFAKFMTNRANQVAFAKVVPVIPTAKGAETDPFFAKAKGSKDPIERATGLVGASGASIKYAIPNVGKTDDLFKNFNDNIEAAFLGRKTAQQALNDSVEFWNKNMKK